VKTAGAVDVSIAEFYKT